MEVGAGDPPGSLRDPGWDGLGGGRTAAIEEKLEPFGTALRWLGEADTGSQPKSVEFFGDGSRVVVALLNGLGVDIFSVVTGCLEKRIEIPEPYGRAGGFVESAYLPGRNEIWVSQMATERVHIIDAETLTYRESVPTGGGWTKILTPSPDEKFLYTSNWSSRNIGVIDTVSRTLVDTIPVTGIPRGMAFGSDGRTLYVCIFETGHIEKIDTKQRKSLGILETGPGAARHIVADPREGRFFVSDMARGRVYAFTESTGRVTDSLRIGPNLNTIKLSSDGRYLFVSSRGRNNPETYLRKGPDFGTITVVDTESFRVVERIWGGNQPTGLALSPDDNRLVFSDFKDDRLEFYDVSGLFY